MIKKSTALLGAAGIIGALMFSPVAAQAAVFDCNSGAIWAYDKDSKQVTKFNPFGTVLSTVTLAQPIDGSGSGDVSINPSYQHLYLVNSEDGVESYNPTSGAMDSGYPKAITGDFVQSSWANAAGVINGGHIIANSDQDTTKLYSIDPATGVSVVWADLSNAEAGLPVGALMGGAWAAKDLVQSADGSVYSLAMNSNYPNSLLVKINASNTTQMTVLGEMPDALGHPWGIARAGDNYYLADGVGSHMYQLGAIGTVASVSKFTVRDVGTWAGVKLVGLAGSNDSNPAPSNCLFNLVTGKVEGPSNAGEGLAATGGSFSDYHSALTGGIVLSVAGATLTIAARRRVKK